MWDDQEKQKQTNYERTVISLIVTMTYMANIKEIVSINRLIISDLLSILNDVLFC